ncbi:methyltransferase family protein [Pseudolysinimonas sp.]|uniref:methyltransferase family protein n=1 Tax=Pseudolysinimonas sp. TaxID=2680009 RepID=UPI003F7F76F8
MIPIPFDDLAATIVFASLLVAFVLVEGGIRLASQRNAAGAPPRERASYVLLVVVLLAAMAGALLVARTGLGAIPVGRWGLFVVGAVLIALGLALRIWAVIVLGRAFTVEVRVREGQAVVDRGPYRAVRHPSYTGLLLVFLGTGVALGDVLSILIAGVPTAAAIVVRIRVEEAALLSAIGEPYRRFAATRKRLIPFVW